MNGYKLMSESEAYRRGVSCVNSQPGTPYKPDGKEAAEFTRGQNDAREHAAKMERYTAWGELEEC